jgi:hypothetical protein
MKINKLDMILVRRSKYSVHIHPDGSPYHSIQVPGYDVGVRVGDSNIIDNLPTMTLDDLKDLRKAIRKLIRDESNKRIQK